MSFCWLLWIAGMVRQMEAVQEAGGARETAMEAPLLVVGIAAGRAGQAGADGVGWTEAAGDPASAAWMAGGLPTLHTLNLLRWNDFRSWE